MSILFIATSTVYDDLYLECCLERYLETDIYIELFYFYVISSGINNFSSQFLGEHREPLS